MYVCVFVCAAYLRKLIKKSGEGRRKNGNKIISSVRACKKDRTGGSWRSSSRERERKKEGEQKESSKSSSHYAEECAQVTIS